MLGNRTMEKTIENAQYWEEKWLNSKMKHSAYSGYSKPEMWNAMAPAYGGPKNKDKDQQAKDVCTILENKGVRFEAARILDLGCGPGQYASAFAQKSARITCIDVSHKMLERLKTETPAAQLEQMEILEADWGKLVPSEHGFTNAFDLVFANMTPAIDGPEAFDKMISASRKWCWYRAWSGPRLNPILEALHLEIFNEPAACYTGPFLSAFNLLCARGYWPDCAFKKIQWTKSRPFDEAVAEFMVFFGNSGGLSETDLKRRISDVLHRFENSGTVEYKAGGITGEMLWNIEKTPIGGVNG